MSLSSEGSGAGPADRASSPEASSESHTREPALDRVAASVAALDALADRPLSEQADLYQRVHTELQAELAEIDGTAAQG
ncbi:MAG: hypothetical protein M3N95_06235 [Actinomycetota bacterium]|nr:hypothetical protein [Actinomycetota bacterium]